MKRKFFTTAALLFCFVLCFALAADLNGKWTGQIKLPDGSDLPLSYNFKVDGTKLTGTADSPSGSVPIEDGKVDGDNFSFKVTVEGAVYPHTGKVYADSCGLDIDLGGMKAHTRLKHNN